MDGSPININNNAGANLTNIATGTTTGKITIGNTGLTGGVEVDGPTTINNNAGTNTTSIGTGSTTGAVTIGNTGLTGGVTIAGSTTINNNAGTNTTSIGTGTTTGAVRVGTAGNTSYLGVGVNPLVRLDVSNNLIDPSIIAAPNTVTHITQADGAANRLLLDALIGGGSARATFTGRVAGGTAGSPTAVPADNVLCEITGQGYGTTGYSSTSMGRMTIHSAESWTDTAQGTYITFQTANKGTTSPTERVRVLDTGSVLIGTTSLASTSPKLQVEAGVLGSTVGNTLELARFGNTNTNVNALRVYQNRFANGTDWQSAETRIQQRTDTTDQAYISLNPDGVGGISLGTGSAASERMRIDGAGAVSFNNTTAYIINPGTSIFTTKGNSSYAAYTQLQNTNNGVNASADLVVTNDVGNAYVDLGINSSGYTGAGISPAFSIVGANDAYLYANASNLAIGTSTNVGDIVFFTGGSAASTNERMRIANNGTISIAGTDVNTLFGKITYAAQASDQNVLNSTTLTNSNSIVINGSSLVSNATYEFESILYFTETSSSVGYKYAFNETVGTGGAQSTIVVMHEIYGYGASSNGLNNIVSNAYLIAANNLVDSTGAASVNGIISTRRGIIKTSSNVAPNTINVQFAQHAVNATTPIILKAGSYLKLTRIA